MNVTNEQPLPTGEEIDKIVDAGWDGLLDRWHLCLDRILEVAYNLSVHRPSAMPPEELRACGLCSVFLEMYSDDALYLLRGYRPASRETNVVAPSRKFAKLKALRDNPSDELLERQLRDIDNAVLLTIDALEVLVKKPGMPSPTRHQLIATYCGLGRLRACESLLETVAYNDISKGAGGEDYFGVGVGMSQRVNEIIPPRCVPIEATITLPSKPSLDCVIAAYLLARFVIGGMIYFEFIDDPEYDPSLTHAEHHATIGVGHPYHLPEALCFDSRAVETERTNTELVIEHAEKLGIPMDFTAGLVLMARGNADEYLYEAGWIETIFGACDTGSQAMQVVEMFLADRFPVSDAYRASNAELRQKALEQNPEYLKYKPRAETPIPAG